VADARAAGPWAGAWPCGADLSCAAPPKCAVVSCEAESTAALPRCFAGPNHVAAQLNVAARYAALLGARDRVRGEWTCAPAGCRIGVVRCGDVRSRFNPKRSSLRARATRLSGE